MNSEIKTCCICGQMFMGWGNNPWPLNTEEDARCCDACDTLVIKERIKRAYMNRHEDKNNGN